MRVHLLIGHYREAYPGQLQPNVFLACDEYILDDNPKWWPEAVAKEKAKCGDEVTTWAEIVIEVDSEKMLDALYPGRSPIAATVVSTHPQPHVGGWVRGRFAEFEEIEDGTAFGKVTEIVDSGYRVIWEAGEAPEFVAAAEVVYADPMEVPDLPSKRIHVPSAGSPAHNTAGAGA